MKRCGGVLMHISSLPGKYGIGTLGEGARRFVDFLTKCGFGAWQVLPTSPCDDYNSPYSGSSAFAGNTYFIDPGILCEKGLLTESELNECVCADIYSTQYEAVKKERTAVFRKAFSRLEKKQREDVALFAVENRNISNYAIFCALKEKHGGMPWYEWDELLKKRNPCALRDAQRELSEEILFHEFMQYEFFAQWSSLKEYANKKGIGIIGDMPMYPSYDSADVWVNPEMFSLDEEMRIVKCAGVPPDYFCADGQKWGNPLYNWDEMKKNDYSFWIERLQAAGKLYDAVRIDHFRAFSAYWAIPIEESAKNGEWIKGPGKALFDKTALICPDVKIIAEDLGEIDDGVKTLLRETGFPGMGVMQFAFISPEDNPHLPHNYTEKTVGYTGTHDNNTILGWLWESSEHDRKYALDYCGFSGDWGEGGAKSGVIRSIIRTLWRSGALCAMVPVQDLCGFGGDTRMNRPGTADGNWCFRLTESAMNDIDTDFYKALNALYKRKSFLKEGIEDA